MGHSLNMDMKTAFHCFRVWGTVAMLGLPGGATLAAEIWDETGVDVSMPEIPDVREVTPALARARSLAKTTALEMGATEVALSPERLAFLRPRLEQLLAEFRLLDAAVDPSLEPAFTPRDGFAEDRDDH